MTHSPYISLPAADADALKVGGDWTLAHYATLLAQVGTARPALGGHSRADLSDLNALDTAGASLLVELIGVCRARPEISTGALLEHFAEREEARALQKLAVADFPGGEGEAAAEFADALRQLERQTDRQRIDDLLRLQAEGALDEAQKARLRALLADKGARS